MGERRGHRGREREAGLRVWQPLGGFGLVGFLWSVRARPDPDVLLGNSSSCLNRQEKKKTEEKKQAWRIKFCFKHAVLVLLPLCDFTRLVLSRHACKHGYQQSVVYVGGKIAFSFFKLEFTFVFGEEKCIENVSGQQSRAQRQQFCTLLPNNNV